MLEIPGPGSGPALINIGGYLWMVSEVFRFAARYPPDRISNPFSKVEHVKSAAVFKRKKIEKFSTLGVLTPPFTSSDISDGLDDWIFKYCG